LYISVACAEGTRRTDIIGRWFGEATRSVSDDDLTAHTWYKSAWELELYFFYDDNYELHYSAHTTNDIVPAFGYGNDYESRWKTFNFVNPYKAEVTLIGHRRESLINGTALSFWLSEYDNTLRFKLTFTNPNGENLRPGVSFTLHRDMEFEGTPKMCDHYCGRFGAYCNITSSQCIRRHHYYKPSLDDITVSPPDSSSSSGSDTPHTVPNNNVASSSNVSEAAPRSSPLLGFLLILMLLSFLCCCAICIRMQRKKAAQAALNALPVAKPQQQQPQPEHQMTVPYPYVSYYPMSYYPAPPQQYTQMPIMYGGQWYVPPQAPQEDQ